MKKIIFKFLMALSFILASYQINAQCSTLSEPTDECADIFISSIDLPESNRAAAPGDKFYLRSNVGDPWGNTSNDAAMDLAFGAGNWTLEFFESLVFADVFNEDTVFVFIDGSDDGADELEAFLTANIADLEDWVFDGGSLIINSAPNEGDGMDFGFNGTSLVYAAFNDDVTADAAHPAIAGPNTPTATAMSGNSYGDATITGSDYTTIVEGNDIADSVVLAEKPWGEGFIMVGGMTTVNFHDPEVEAANFRANLFVYMDENSLLNTDDFVASNFAIYPNPAQNEINVNAANTIEKIAIINITGQRVMDLEIGATQKSINIESLPSGVYFLEATINGSTGVERIIKQ